MAAIQTIGMYWDKIKTERRRLEEEAYIRINREMDNLVHEFEGQIVRAKSEGSKMSEIARAMGASRDTAYRYYRAGLEHVDIAGPGTKFGINHPYDPFLTAEGHRILIDWPEWMNPDASDWEKRQRMWVPMDLTGTVEHDGSKWVSADTEDDGWYLQDHPEEVRLRKALGAPAFQNALNEWSGK